MNLWTKVKLLFVKGVWFHDPDGVSLYVKCIDGTVHVLKEIHWSKTRYSKEQDDND